VLYTIIPVVGPNEKEQYSGSPGTAFRITGWYFLVVFHLISWNNRESSCPSIVLGFGKYETVDAQ